MICARCGVRFSYRTKGWKAIDREKKLYLCPRCAGYKKQTRLYKHTGMELVAGDWVTPRQPPQHLKTQDLSDYVFGRQTSETIARELKHYRLWLERVKATGVRHPEDPFKMLPPTHSLAKRQIKRLRTEIKYLEGKITLARYHDIVEGMR